MYGDKMSENAILMGKVGIVGNHLHHYKSDSSIYQKRFNGWGYLKEN